jgi:hypothetical protein
MLVPVPPAAAAARRSAASTAPPGKTDTEGMKEDLAVRCTRHTR